MKLVLELPCLISKKTRQGNAILFPWGVHPVAMASNGRLPGDTLLRSILCPGLSSCKATLIFRGCPRRDVSNTPRKSKRREYTLRTRDPPWFRCFCCSECMFEYHITGTTSQVRLTRGNRVGPCSQSLANVRPRYLLAG